MDYDPNQFCSTREAAKILGVSLRTVQLWVESGVLQAWKTAGGHRRVTMNSVQKLVDERDRINSATNTSTRVIEKQSAPIRILIVDDDEDILKLLELEILDWGWRCELVTARNGFEALISIGEAKPQLLISDLNMPGMDGIRMIQTLRTNALYQDMAIIVITGLDEAAIKVSGLPEGVPIFPKPIPFVKLREAAQKLVGLS